MARSLSLKERSFYHQLQPIKSGYPLALHNNRKAVMLELLPIKALVVPD
jgi:hypothetical protein